MEAERLRDCSPPARQVAVVSLKCWRICAGYGLAVSAEASRPDGQEADALLFTWERRAMLATFAHSNSANRCAAWDVRLGSISVVLTAIVGTSVFAALQKDFNTAARIAVGILTVGAAASSAVHVFAALPDRKAAYERAARRHAAVRRRIESARAKLAASGGSFDAWEEIGAIREEMDSVAASSPNAAGRIWIKTRRQMKGEFTRRERFWAKLRGLTLDPVGVAPSVDGPLQRLSDADDERDG